MSEETNRTEPITRKTERGRRLSGHLTIMGSRALDKIQDATGARMYDVLSTAVIYYAQLLANGALPHTMSPIYQSTPRPNPTGKKADNPTTVALGAAKAIWCEEFGGKVDGNLCIFEKYEVTLAGQTESSVRTVSLKEMPDQKEDFKKLILGGYDNVYEAKRAMGEKV